MEALVFRCIALLDGMKCSRCDQRPKKEDALKHVLLKECNVLCLSSALNAALSIHRQIYVGDITKIFMRDAELEPFVYNAALKHASDNGRRLHILPCDSNLHEKLLAQIKDWLYAGRNCVMEEPAQTAAKSFFTDEDLDSMFLLEGLQKIGFVQEAYENFVSFHLPSGVAKIELANSLKMYRDNMLSNFSAFTVKSNWFFSRYLSAANDRIKQDYIENAELYSEEQFSKRYPMFYKESVETRERLKNMQALRIDGKETKLALTQEIPQELSSNNWALLPLNMRPEIAEAALVLCDIEPKPTSLSELKAALGPVCRVTYAVSPKGVLTNFSNNSNLEPVDFCNKPMSIYVGLVSQMESVMLNDCTKLPSFLRISAKARKKYGLAEMDTGDQAISGLKNLNNFQRYMLERAKALSRQQRASVIFKDEFAEQKCKNDLVQWLECISDDITDNNVVTPKQFTAKLVEFGLHEKSIPVEAIIKSLQDYEYLKISQGMISYCSTTDTKSLAEKIKKNEEDFLSSLNSYYQELSSRNQSQAISSRKRAHDTKLPYGRTKIPKAENCIRI